MAEAKMKIETSVKKIRGPTNRYPWEELEVGQSFLCTANHRTAVYTIARAASFRYAPKKFEGGRGEDGKMHIWRVA